MPVFYEKTKKQNDLSVVIVYYNVCTAAFLNLKKRFWFACEATCQHGEKTGEIRPAGS